MGKWNRRYLPRQKQRQYDYEDPPSSPYNNPLSYPSSGIEDSNMRSWEIDFCHSLRVPWRRVVASKKYIYSYPSVLNWDDSAGREAFDDAKQRYWAMINGIPYDSPLPSPDMFIDDVDWDPHLDPQLMEDLDRQFFNPDEEHKVVKLETINEEVGFAQTEDNKNQSINDNPWERNHAQGTGSIKDISQGWNKWDESVNSKKNNPWEQSASQLVDSSRDDAWGSGNASWSWNKWPSSVVDNKCGDPCTNGHPSVAGRQEGWGRSQSTSCSWNNWKPDDQRVANNWSSWGNDFPNGRDSTYKRDRSWGWRDSNYRVNEANYGDSGRFQRGERSFRGGCRKRESSIQYTSNYKSSRYQTHNYGDSVNY